MATSKFQRNRLERDFEMLKFKSDLNRWEESLVIDDFFTVSIAAAMDEIGNKRSGSITPQFLLTADGILLHKDFSRSNLTSVRRTMRLPLCWLHFHIQLNGKFHMESKARRETINDARTVVSERKLTERFFQISVIWKCETGFGHFFWHHLNVYVLELTTKRSAHLRVSQLTPTREFRHGRRWS